MTIPATKMCSYFANTWRSLLREEAVRAVALRRSSRVAEVSEHLCVRCPTSREQISGATRKLARLSTLVGLQALLLSLRGLTEGIISSWKNGREFSTLLRKVGGKRPRSRGRGLVAFSMIDIRLKMTEMGAQMAFL